MMSAPYRSVEAIRKARYPRAPQRPEDRRKNKDRYQRPPRGAPRKPR